MIIRIDKNKIRDFFFCDIPLLLLALNYVLYNALSYSEIKNPIRIAALLLVLVGWVIKGEYHLSKTESIFAVLAILELIINGSQSLNLVALVFFAICSTREIEEDVKHMFVISLALCILMLTLTRLGLVTNKSYISTFGRARTTLGFNNPNVGALFFSSAIYLFLISRTKIRLLDIGISCVFGFLIYYFTNSRTALVSMAVFLLMIIIVVLRERGWKIAIEKVCKVLVDMMFALNFLSIFFINKLMQFDVITSFRISSFHKMINEAGIKGFLIGGTIRTVDSFYYMMIFSYGVIAYLVFAIFVHTAIKKLSEFKRYKMIAFLTAVFVCGIMESSIIRPEILSMLLVWKIVIQPEKLEVQRK